MKEYGKVRAQVNGFTDAGKITIVNKCRSFTILNQGLNDANLTINGNTISFLAGSTIVFGGYTDLLRSDQIEINFVGAGAKNIVIIQDIILEYANFIK